MSLIFENCIQTEIKIIDYQNKYINKIPRTWRCGKTLKSMARYVSKLPNSRSGLWHQILEFMKEVILKKFGAAMWIPFTRFRTWTTDKLLRTQ
jgi:hypothetical protein